MMVYSLVLQTVHEQPATPEVDGAYTILRVVQPFNLKLKPSRIVCTQTIAILWKDTVDTRLIAIAEKALIAGVLPPVKVLYAAKGDLNIVYNRDFHPGNALKFYKSWAKLAQGAWYDAWIPKFFGEQEIPYQIGNCFFGRIREILNSRELGIQPFTEEMFLFHDEWEPANMFGPDYAEQAENTRAEIANGAFDLDADTDYPIF